MRLLLLFLVTPVVELALLVKLGQVVGFWPTVGLIVLTGVAGSLLARHQGLSTWRRFNARLASGDMPGRELVDGVLILLAGALLITPGVVTDIVGFLGLLPVTRSHVRRFVSKRLQQKLKDGTVRVNFAGYDRPFSHPADPEQSTDRQTDRWSGRPRSQPAHTRPEDRHPGSR